MAYVSHFPHGNGTELRVRLRALDPAVARAQIGTRREALRPPKTTQAEIKQVEFEATVSEGLLLSIQFAGKASFDVAQGPDFESIVVGIGRPGSSRACKPVFPSSALWDTTTVPAEASAAQTAPAGRSVRAATRAGGKISPGQVRESGAAMDEGRAALRRKQYADAVRLFRKVLAYPEHEFSAEAQELLGVTYQKMGNNAAARAEYEDYLRRYPNRDGADAVNQRLASVTPRNTEGPGSGQLRAPKRRTGVETWTISGSASQFYIRDDSFRTLKDPSLPPDFNEDKDAHRVHKNALLSTLDLIATYQSDAIKAKFRFSGTEEHNFGDDERGDVTGVAALFLETTFRDYDVMTRIGRQTRSTGGVLGRFDGALVSWQVNPMLRLNGIGGSPVASRLDSPFKDEKVLYGASVDVGTFWSGFDSSFYFIEQQAAGTLDRRAIGTEWRYVDKSKAAFVTVDYDIHFNELNLAIFNGHWTLPDKSTFTALADYRKAPFLTTSNALQGQLLGSLDELRRVYTDDGVKRLALDRTASATMGTVGYSRPINSIVQVAFDATIANFSSTPSSGGVAGMESSGNEFYYSAQLIGSNVFKEGDISVIGLRYADRQFSDIYALDLSTRYPLTEKWRIKPGLHLSYRTGTDDMKEIAITPSLLLNYFVTKDLSFEVEGGVRWSRREQGAMTETEADFFVLAGYRFDFYADGQRANKP